MMDITGQFFLWWFTAWNIGGWVVFFLVAIAALAWLIFDTATRRIRAVGWVLGAILPVLFLLPSAVVGFSVIARAQMQNLLEIFFYLGLIGAIVPLVVAVGYGITYQGMRGCERGHLYQAALGDCPICAQERAPQIPPVSPPAPFIPLPAPRPDRREVIASTPPPCPKVNAWLADEQSGRTHQLCQGDTRIGRSMQVNEIVLTDKSISREHLLIREERGHFTLYDRGSKTGTRVNGRRLDGSMLLEHDDVIEAGDARLRFVTTR